MLSSEQPWRHERGHVPTSVDWETGIKRGSDWLKPDSISDKKTLFLALVSRVPPKGYDLGTTLKSTNLNLFYKPCVLNIIACIVKYMTFYNFWDGKKWLRFLITISVESWKYILGLFLREVLWSGALLLQP